MDTRRIAATALLAVGLAAGCAGDGTEGGTEIEDGVVPPGAIPAAPDVRPGTLEGAQGGVAQTGAMGDSAANAAGPAPVPASESVR